MLTGDENIVDIHFEVQWKIRDAEKFLFNTRNPQIAVKSAAESAMREVMGQNPITNALTEKKLEMELAAKSLLQDILDSYETGIEVILMQMLKVDPPEEVIDAQRDVQTAKADLERLINEAQAYRNDIIPKHVVKQNKCYKKLRPTNKKSSPKHKVKPPALSPSTTNTRAPKTSPKNACIWK